MTEYKDFLLWGLSIFSGLLFFLLNKQNDKIKNIESQLSDKKYKTYHELFSIFFELLKGQKNIKESNEKDTVEKLIDIKKDMMIYAPDKVLNKFLEWQNFVGDHPSDQKHLIIYLDLLVLIRKDMGNSKSQITRDDILRSIFSSSDEMLKFNNQIGNSSSK